MPCPHCGSATTQQQHRWQHAFAQPTTNCATTSGIGSGWTRLSRWASNGSNSGPGRRRCGQCSRRRRQQAERNYPLHPTLTAPSDHLLLPNLTQPGETHLQRILLGTRPTSTGSDRTKDCSSAALTRPWRMHVRQGPCGSLRWAACITLTDQQRAVARTAISARTGTSTGPTGTFHAYNLGGQNSRQFGLTTPDSYKGHTTESPVKRILAYTSSTANSTPRLCKAIMSPGP